MFSLTSEYALRAVVWLADQSEGEVFGARTIAEETQVPPSYLAKIMQLLVHAEVVTSHRGVSGGFKLEHAPGALRVLDVVNAVDPITKFTTCLLKLKTHAKHRCAMHARLNEAIENVEAALGDSTIADILNDSTRPKPMSDTRH